MKGILNGFATTAHSEQTAIKPTRTKSQFRTKRKPRVSARSRVPANTNTCVLKEQTVLKHSDEVCKEKEVRHVRKANTGSTNKSRTTRPRYARRPSPPLLRVSASHDKLNKNLSRKIYHKNKQNEATPKTGKSSSTPSKKKDNSTNDAIHSIQLALKEHYYRKTSTQYFRRLSEDMSECEVLHHQKTRKNRKISWDNDTKIRTFEESETPNRFIQDVTSSIKDQP